MRFPKPSVVIRRETWSNRSRRRPKAACFSLFRGTRRERIWSRGGPPAPVHSPDRWRRPIDRKRTHQRRGKCPSPAQVSPRRAATDRPEGQTPHNAADAQVTCHSDESPGIAAAAIARTVANDCGRDIVAEGRRRMGRDGAIVANPRNGGRDLGCRPGVRGDLANRYMQAKETVDRQPPSSWRNSIAWRESGVAKTQCRLIRLGGKAVGSGSAADEDDDAAKKPDKRAAPRALKRVP